MLKILIGLIFVLALAAVIWSYSAYFKFEAKSIDTSTQALGEAKDVKAQLEKNFANTMKQAK
jgi:hypothetical protein